MANKKENGVTKLSDEMEEMRLKAIEVELKARFWKAQYEIRYYTLEAEKIQPEYEKYVEKQREMNDKLMKEYMEQLQKENGPVPEAEVNGDPSEQAE